MRKLAIPLYEFCPISEDWGKISIPNLVKNVSYEMLLNAAKFQGYGFYHFMVIKGKPTEGKPFGLRLRLENKDDLKN